MRLSAALAALCLLLHLSTTIAGATNITKAFIVFSNHLDIGYTDNKVSRFPIRWLPTTTIR